VRRRLSHAHAELVRAPRHLKRQHTEHAEAGNDEREHTEESAECGQPPYKGILHINM
jgi:hypothetical protein